MVHRLLATCYLSLFFLCLPFSFPALAECHPYTSAHEHLGETTCIRGKVVKLVISPSGLHFLNFCEDYKECPFTVVVFPRDLRDVGDVRTLEGKEIQITGKVKTYKGQLEIILRDRSQLRGDTANLPNLPKTYDASRKGSYSAGAFKGSSTPTNNTAKKKGRREPTFPEDE